MGRMSTRVVDPKGVGLLLIDSHPAGSARTVRDMCAEVDERSAAPAAPLRRPVVIVVGSSAGYGLACTVAGLRRHGVNGVGVCLERPPAGRRTATAGWYRTAELAEVARLGGSEFAFVNADAFDDATKQEVATLAADRFGGVDYLIYSVAAPRRVDSRSGVTYRSAIKPIGSPYRTKTLRMGEDGAHAVDEITVEAATEAEVEETVKVMGGDDWVRWIDALAARDLLRPGFTTVALSYIGSSLNSRIYRDGSIGTAKADLERSAVELAQGHENRGVRAMISINGAAVTQASSAIPGIGLYLSLLHRCLGGQLRSPAHQAVDLWDQLTGTAALDLDEEGRIRLDGWELDAAVQEKIRRAWAAVNTERLAELADAGWFYDSVFQLYGFRVAGVDYAQPCQVDVEWPAGFTTP